MPINWTPWFNVPFHRRLEVFCAGFTLFLVVGFPAVAVPAIIYIFLVKLFGLIERQIKTLNSTLFALITGCHFNFHLECRTHLDEDIVRAIFGIRLL